MLKVKPCAPIFAAQYTASNNSPNQLGLAADLLALIRYYPFGPPVRFVQVLDRNRPHKYNVIRDYPNASTRFQLWTGVVSPTQLPNAGIIQYDDPSQIR